MLSEPECRVLSRAFDVMMTDFDPKDAVVFLECSGLLSEDQAEKIEAKGTRLERLRELLRIYRRQASDCESLISYFEYAAQEHIAETLRTELEHAMDGPESREAVARLPRHVRMHKLLAGSVPRVWKHVKRERLQTAVADVLRERADLDSFFVVLHGIAGCGKSSLAATVFAEVPDLLGGCFESVIWLRDSSTDPKRARHLFADLLLMLSDAVTSDTAKIESSSSVYLCKQIQEALIDRPNLIVVLDDVVQEETVKLANQFGLRVLATTRNADLFASASCSVDVIHVENLTLEESKELLRVDETALQGSDDVTQSAVNAAFSVSSGNAALLTMLKKMADGRAVRLSTYSRRLSERGLSSVTVATSYECKSMHEALTTSVERLPQKDRDTLACAAILPSDEDIPLEVWGLFVPVDLVDADETEFMMLLSDRLMQLCRNGDFLSHNSLRDAFRISRMVELYLRETVDSVTIKTLIGILKCRLEKYRSRGFDNPLVRDFFLAHASFYKTVHGVDI